MQVISDPNSNNKLQTDKKTVAVEDSRFDYQPGTPTAEIQNRGVETHKHQGHHHAELSGRETIEGVLWGNLSIGNAPKR